MNAPTNPPAAPYGATERPAGIPVTLKDNSTFVWAWPYRSKAGEVQGYVARYRTPDGGKTFRQFFNQEQGRWKAGAPPKPWPLFGLESVKASTETVYIVEGERKADALHQFELPAVSSLAGAGNADKADWEPVETCKKIIIMPDNDEPGDGYAKDVARMLSRLPGEREVLIAPFPGLSNGEDVIDWIQARVPSWCGYGLIPREAVDDLQDQFLEAIEGCVELPPPASLEHPQQPGSVAHATGAKHGWPDVQALPPRGSMDSASEYPVSSLPSPVRNAALEVARFAKVPVASPSVIGLAALAVAIGKKAVIEERLGLTHFPALFFALVAPSGERKSPPFKAMCAPIEEWTKEKLPEYEENLRKSNAFNSVIDAKITGITNRAKSEARTKGSSAAKKKTNKGTNIPNDDADLEKVAKEIQALERRRVCSPAHPRPYTTDSTEERLFQKMHDRGGAYAVMSGEGRPVFDQIMGKFSGKERTGDAIYLAGISGDTITRDRVGGARGPEDRAIFEPCLNVCVMVQPDKYLEFAVHTSLRSSGALARVLPVYLPSLVGSRFEEADEEDLRDDKMAEYKDLLKSILQTDPDDVPHVVGLSNAARERRRQLHNEIECLMNNGGNLDDVRDIASKAVSQICKIALVLHIAKNPDVLREDRSELDETTWAEAESIGRYHLQEAVRVQRMAEESTNLEKARVILHWIQMQGYREVTASQIATFSPRPRPMARNVSEIMEILIDHGCVRGKPGILGRSVVYEVNPALHSQNSQNSQHGGAR